jgi:hypothetical protein
VAAFERLDERQALTFEHIRLGNRFRLWSVDGWRQTAELALSFGQGGCAIQEFRLSESRRWLVTRRASGQGEWGYDLIATRPLERIAGVESRRGYLLELPRFSPDETRLLGGYGPRWLGGWWAPAGDLEDPSPGGRVSFGWLFVHHLPSGESSWHELVMDLPRGYRPDDVEDEAWFGASGIEPFGPHGARILLPGGAPFEMKGPLPAVIVLPVPRQDRDC